MTRWSQIDHRYAPAFLAVGVAVAIAISATATAAASSSTTGRAVTVRCTETLKNAEITNGGVAGTGHCTIRGAINDQGRATDYRTQIANTALIRRVVVGQRGTIAFLIRINLSTGSEPWTVRSGTGAYRGLRGAGRQVVDDFFSTPATFVMKGTVTR